ncbi:hypothetical protein [Ursidibacter arcticus]
MLLAKCGFTAQQVWAMSHLEVSSWVQAYLVSQGVKQSVGVRFNPKSTIVSARKTKTE